MCKCAIATIVPIPPYNSLNKHLLINKYMTGLFKLLTQKLRILLLLLGAHRINTVKLFRVSNMVLNDLSATCIPTEVLKHSRKGKPLDKFEYRSYTDKKLCIISCHREYLTRQDKHVGLNTDQLIIRLKKPCIGASIDTVRRWVKDIFILNIDFSPRSCWAASMSKAKNVEVNIDEMLKQGCWKNRKNFFIYYDKVIIEYAPDDIDFNRICQV